MKIRLLNSVLFLYTIIWSLPLWNHGQNRWGQDHQYKCYEHTGWKERGNLLASYPGLPIFFNVTRFFSCNVEKYWKAWGTKLEIFPNSCLGKQKCFGWCGLLPTVHRSLAWACVEIGGFTELALATCMRRGVAACVRKNNYLCNDYVVCTNQS